MRKRQKLNFLLPVTLLVAAIIVLSVSVCVKRTHDKMTQYSFDELAAKTRSVADDFYNATQTDTIILNAMAGLLHLRGCERPARAEQPQRPCGRRPDAAVRGRQPEKAVLRSGLDRVVEKADEIMLQNKKEYYAARTRREPR